MIDSSPPNKCETHCHVQTLQKQGPRSNSTILETLEHPNLLWEIKGQRDKTQGRKVLSADFPGKAVLIFVTSHPSSSQGKKEVGGSISNPRSQEGRHQRVIWRVCHMFLEGTCSWTNDLIPGSDRGQLRSPVVGAERWWLCPSSCQGGGSLSKFP